jgi:hypothetical protein
MGISMGSQMAGSFGRESSGLGFAGDDPNGAMSVVRYSFHNLVGRSVHGAMCACERGVSLDESLIE